MRGRPSIVVGHGWQWYTETATLSMSDTGSLRDIFEEAEEKWLTTERLFWNSFPFVLPMDRLLIVRGEVSRPGVGWFGRIESEDGWTFERKEEVVELASPSVGLSRRLDLIGGRS